LLDENYDYLNHSGCGNTLNCNHPVVRKMIIDSLRFFVIEMHVDGFRFDLASILSRDENGDVMPNPPLLELIAKDPILAKTKIIAEAWDASGLYQVGSFPASKRWAEWNDRYRDLVRRFCKGEAGLTAELATRIAGSEDLYKHSDRNPFHSINFVTAHDGFTMMDLVSYKQKHNQENGEDNKDGVDVNHSLNFGIEGNTHDPTVLKQRFKQIRNMATLLMLSQGTPMVLSGDEFGNSQNGNNNAWCQDNLISWLDWKLSEKNSDLLVFWQKLIAFRKKHASLRRDRFFTGKKNRISGLRDISWHNTCVADPEFNKMTRSLAFLVHGMDGDTIIDDTLYVILNFNELDTEFEIPFQKSVIPWNMVLNTARPKDFINDRIVELEPHQGSVRVLAFSIVILTRQTLARKTPATTR
jgi:glycogen operon protein